LKACCRKVFNALITIMGINRLHKVGLSMPIMVINALKTFLQQAFKMPVLPSTKNCHITFQVV